MTGLLGQLLRVVRVGPALQNQAIVADQEPEVGDPATQLAANVVGKPGQVNGH